jgi:flagellin
MISALSAATLQIAGFYNQNSYDLSKTLERLSSGKKFLTPADDVSSYMRAKDLQSQADGYDPVITNLSEWQGAMSVASSAAGEISNTLQRLSELVTLSQQSTDSNQKDAYQSEFTQLVNNADKIVKSTYYENTYLLNNTTGTTQATVYLNPDTSLTASLDINLPVAVDSTAITHLQAVNIGSTAPDYVNAAKYVGDATAENNTFIATAAGYTTTLNSFYNIASTTKTNTLSAVSNISDIDDAAEMVKYTMQSVHQQTATAMMAQANLFSQSILALFQNM